jgi:hypothetical protein
MTVFWSQCLPQEPASMPWTINGYGAVMQANKALLLQSAREAPPHLQALMMAMAMIETTTLSAADRDATKDTKGASANVSLFNLSLDLVRCVDPSVDPWALNTDTALAVRVIQQGIAKWGIPTFLNFVRGGRTAFKDGHSYGAAAYRNTVATTLMLIDRFPGLMKDDRRVDVDLEHV